MPLHLRRRGEIWHVRGTVRVGRQTIDVREHSTGCRARADAAAAAAAEEARIRADALDGGVGRPSRLTIDDCLSAYLTRPGGVVANDKAKVRDMSDRIGGRLVSDAPAAWAEILRTRGAYWAPGTAARWRTILQAALNSGADAHQMRRVRLPDVEESDVEIAVYLTRAEQERLLSAYNPHVAPIALVLCFAGLRTQEALRLDWRQVDWRQGSLFIPGGERQGGRARRRAKSGKGRSVPMHPRVRFALRAIWERAGQPDTGAVFISSKGEPYRDTRGVGGNPLAQAHHTACVRAGLCEPTGRRDDKGRPIMGHTFRVHDWRHHWASWLVMTGTDLVTLMRLGGWTTPRMVQKYAALSGAHMADAIARLA